MCKREIERERGRESLPLLYLHPASSINTATEELRNRRVAPVTPANITSRDRVKTARSQGKKLADGMQERMWVQVQPRCSSRGSLIALRLWVIKTSLSVFALAQSPCEHQTLVGLQSE